jgi:hypothetical protein
MPAAFNLATPSLEDQWRAIILFGANVASYKFALAKTLLELAPNEGDILKLEQLAIPFARHVSEHLKLADKQSTSASSRFLDSCRKFNRGEIAEDELAAHCSRLGFVNVIDAFHIVNRSPTSAAFFVDERKNRGGIRITENFSRFLAGQRKSTLTAEVESRWRLVETAWELGVNRNLVGIEFQPEGETLVSVDRLLRRKPVTGSRSALNGYQRGRCFYCFSPLDISEGQTNTDVDHFFPHVLKNHGFGGLVDGVWNLVLSCKDCNRGKDGKSALLPSPQLLERLHARNEFLIESHHPLRETIMGQTGSTEIERIQFLKMWHSEALQRLIHLWEPRK